MPGRVGLLYISHQPARPGNNLAIDAIQEKLLKETEAIRYGMTKEPPPKPGIPAYFWEAFAG